jgi:ABC-type antimicrobial peptide transport system ATPase subunit
LIQPPSGCRFHPRCAHAQREHALTAPQLAPVPGDERHRVACLLAADARRALWQQARGGATPHEQVER